MSQQINTPMFPIISWTYTFDGTEEITFDNGPISHTYTLSGTFNGYGTNGASNLASSGTIAAYFAALLEDFIDKEIGIASTVIAEYVTGSGINAGHIQTKFSYTSAYAGGNIEFSFDNNSTANVFGFENIDNEILTLTKLVFNDWDSISYFAPLQLTCIDARNTTAKVSVSEQTLSATSYSFNRWGDSVTDIVLTHPVTYAAQIFSYRASDSTFADSANRDVDCINNLYENMIEAARNGETFSVWYEQDATSAEFTAKIIDSETLNSLSTGLEDISGRGRLFSVSTPFRGLS